MAETADKMSLQPSRVLLVEDDAEDTQIVERLLRRGEGRTLDTHAVATLAEAQSSLQQQRFDACLLDLSLPDSSGLETVQTLMDWAPGLPVIVLSGLDDEEVAIQAVHFGAQDFIMKASISQATLRRAIYYAIERKRAESALAQRALYDELTGTCTRALLEDRWLPASNRARREQTWLGILMIDLDGFKAINDSHGHACGDVVLRTVGARLVTAVRENDTVARFGGDEFVVLLEDIRGLEDARQVAEKIVSAICEPVIYESVNLPISASVGIAISGPGQADDLASVLNRADLDMYNNKRARAQGSRPGEIVASSHFGNLVPASFLKTGSES